MTADLERRRREGKRPFDGVTLELERWVSAPALSAVLSELVAYLRPFASENLFQLLDWHEHDGYLTPAVEACREDLEALVGSPGTLLRAFAGGDTWVYHAYFPERHAFYLRFYLSVDEDPRVEAQGTFDLTCSRQLAECARSTIAYDQSRVFRMVPAQAFFNAQYAG